MKKIALLTSGGDAPGMNMAVRSAYMMAKSFGLEVIGVVGGYNGLIESDFVDLTLSDVEKSFRLGGSFLKTSRCEKFLEEKYIDIAVENIKNQGIDALIVFGGDGSFKGALELQKRGVCVNTVPCTIDNDLGYSQTIGFDSAVSKAVSCVDDVRETMSSYDKICVVEVMGRNCGDIALYTGLASGAEVVLVPEENWTEEMLANKLKMSVDNGEKSAIVIVAEGVSSCEHIKDIIKEKLNVEAKTMVVGYMQRGGAPSSMDRILASRMATRAVLLLNKKKYGLAVGYSEGKIFETPIIKALSHKKSFDRELLYINDTISF